MVMKMESFGVDDDGDPLEDLNDDSQEDVGGEFGSAGAIGTGASSRARMLAQQRELQLKKRHAAIQSSGMIRASADGPIGDLAAQEDKKKDNKFTPAVRQFSAPKAVKDPSADISEQNSEFQGRNDSTLPRRVPAEDTTGSRRWNRDSRDDYYDDDRDRERYQDRDRDRDRSWNKSKFDDDYHDRYQDQRGRRYEDDYDYDRRGRPSAGARDNRRGNGDEWEDAGSRDRYASGSGSRHNTRDDNTRDRDRERERARERVAAAEPRRPYPLDLSDKRKFLSRLSYHYIFSFVSVLLIHALSSFFLFYYALYIVLYLRKLVSCNVTFEEIKVQVLRILHILSI